MRLKTLFFPIMLVISISIFAGYIWPEILRLKEVNEEKLVRNEELKGVNAKKVAIESMGKQISSSESEGFVKDYLPENKVEERIISGINYLANDANVSLVDINLIAKEEPVAAVENTNPGIAGALNPVANADAMLGGPNAGAPVPTGILTGNVKTKSVEISISGDYEKIKIFLNGLHDMPLFNTVKSVIISKQASSGQGEEAVTSNTLSADIEVDFGYMRVAKVDSSKLSYLESGIDNQTIEVLKKYISKKTQILEAVEGEKGKVNPFSLN